MFLRGRNFLEEVSPPELCSEAPFSRILNKNPQSRFETRLWIFLAIGERASGGRIPKNSKKTTALSDERSCGFFC
jgi:hypothetical protein